MEFDGISSEVVMCEEGNLRVSSLGFEGLIVVGWDGVDTERLSPALEEVARALIAGSSYDEIAAARGTSRNTIDKQVQALYAYFDVNSRAEFVRIWTEPGSR
jgi:DNA-binding CsgD family transcriptional regulator